MTRQSEYLDTIDLSPEVRALLAQNAALAQEEAGFTPVSDDESLCDDESFNDLTGCSAGGFAFAMVMGLLIGSVCTWLAFALAEYPK